METHSIHPDLLRRRVRVLVVGCGATGSAVVAGLPYLHQALIACGHPGGLHVTVVDGDLISPTNCVRQPFSRFESGHYKTVVLVNRRSRTRLRTVFELYPGSVDGSLDDDALPSCSAAEAIEKQEPFVNQVLAQHTLALLARLFRYGNVSYHGGFINLRDGCGGRLPVDPKLWRRIRKRNAAAA